MKASLLSDLSLLFHVEACNASGFDGDAEGERLKSIGEELGRAATKAAERERTGVSLRPYQTRAIERVLGLFAAGRRRVLLVLPTGAGKTVVASEIVRRTCEIYTCHAVFLAHRRELVRQAFCKLVRNGLDASDVGVVMSGVEWRVDRELHAQAPADLDDEQLWARWARRRPPASIQVGSIDTFRTKTRPKAGLVVVDEAHRALAKSYVDVQAAYPEAFHLGLTATPFRADGKGLGEAYDEIVIGATYAELVADGFLVAPRCYGSPKKVDLSGVRRSKGDYNADDLSKAVDRAELVGDVVEHWQRLGNNATTFAFAVSVAHSKHLRDRFIAASIPAAHVDGETPTEDRDAAFRALRDGSIKVLCNCDVATEGTDVPCVKTIILARPTLSERIYLQQVGRGSRPYEGKPFVVLDHAGCCVEFGLPQEEREYSLEGRKKRKREGLTQAPAKECPGCHGIVGISTMACPMCGHVFEPAAVETPREKEGQLVELTETQRSRLAQWNALCRAWGWQNFERMARDERLLEPGWTKFEWRRTTGIDWPPKGSRMPAFDAVEAAYQRDHAERERLQKERDRGYDRDRARRARGVQRAMGDR